MEKAESSRKAERIKQAYFNEPVDVNRSDCQVFAQLQHTCELIPNVGISCKPLWRVFKICGGRSLEITPFTTVTDTGEIIFTEDMRPTAGKSWHDSHPAL